MTQQVLTFHGCHPMKHSLIKGDILYQYYDKTKWLQKQDGGQMLDSQMH